MKKDPTNLKHYSLDVWYAHGSVYSKGHQLENAFAQDVMREYNARINWGTLRHRYARAVPIPGERDMGLVFCDGPGRGAFPITEAEVIR